MTETNVLGDSLNKFKQSFNSFSGVQFIENQQIKPVSREHKLHTIRLNNIIKRNEKATKEESKKDKSTVFNIEAYFEQCKRSEEINYGKT